MNRVPEEKRVNANFEERANAAFEQGTQSYANDLLAEIRTNWRENEKLITRISGYLVALAVTFEVVFTNKASVTTFLFVSIKNTTIVEFAIPLIIAYMYSYATYSFIESEVYQISHDKVIERVYPNIYGSDFEWLLHPSNAIAGSVDMLRYSIGPETKLTKWSDRTGGIRPLAIVLLPPPFAVAAYIQLFISYGVTYVALWISFAIAIVLLICGIINIYVTFEVE